MPVRPISTAEWVCQSELSHVISHTLNERESTGSLLLLPVVCVGVSTVLYSNCHAWTV